MGTHTQTSKPLTHTHTHILQMSSQNQFYDQNNTQNNYWQAPPPPPKDYNSSNFDSTAPPPTAPSSHGVPKYEWVLASGQVNDLEGVLDDANSHQLLAVVAPVHHQRVHQTLQSGTGPCGI